VDKMDRNRSSASGSSSTIMVRSFCITLFYLFF
jgi:hypothetical protein